MRYNSRTGVQIAAATKIPVDASDEELSLSLSYKFDQHVRMFLAKDNNTQHATHRDRDTERNTHRDRDKAQVLRTICTSDTFP